MRPECLCVSRERILLKKSPLIPIRMLSASNNGGKGNVWLLGKPLVTSNSHSEISFTRCGQILSSD
jgi:hypothetical protein